MHSSARQHLLSLMGAFLCLAPAGMFAQPTVIPGHAHNDYEHDRPLLDALENGFRSVEADVHLVDDHLLVAHDREDVRSDRTLETLYLIPLRERAESNSNRVYATGEEMILLIDIKGEAEATHAALRKVLEKYAGMLTRVEGEMVTTNAVRVVLSGNRPIETVAAETDRRMFIDGRIGDLGGETPPTVMPLISDNWNNLFEWRGDGEMPEEQAERLRQRVEQAHEEGRWIRFWAVPDTEAAWRIQRDAGVDFINTDRLDALREHLTTVDAPAHGDEPAR